MLLIGTSGTALSAHERQQLRSPMVCGLVLFKRNFASRDQVAALIAEVREVRPDPGFVIAVDQEGGVVQRFREGFTRLPALATLGALYDRDPEQARALAEEHAWVMASELRATDVDISFAPVVDLARGNRIIGTRALHAEPEVVSALADAYIRGMHMAGMAVTIKHFPGHGTVLEDTHVESAIDPRPLDDLRASDLQPFAESIALGVEAVMMAHIVYPQVDTASAGQSRIWIEDILRREMGFQGLIFSDDISMVGAGQSGSLEQRVKAHAEAGCDLILACQPDAVDAALQAVENLALEPCPADRVETLRGAVAATWTDLIDNPQRDVFVARLDALRNEETQA
ncbi:beta-N-acetylhexosaminidase [Oleiagrimonas soli]|uniref:Beta-hexosaminidase n=1 Tax=Oleiagrimonas soli TaxID=1543381 RepID=A0A099CU17_9GAMM|nr:beta-N-acetylhexosaminidase [Oleiagrimonas soli]KGI77453.1 beta-hexosaminidase [Oleiagrimonas soli]MBB6183101.1 beta-N-acetylhexosaminidase [Oleiagrimonas soli]